MNKFYLLLAAVLIGVPCSARSLKQSRGSDSGTITRHVSGAIDRAAKVRASKAPKVDRVAPAAAITDTKELEGEYVWSFFDYSFGSEWEEYIDITVGDAENQVKIYIGDEWGCSGAFIGEVDFEAGTLTIEANQEFSYSEADESGKVWDFRAVFAHYVWNDTQDDVILTDDPFVATIGDGVITFPPDVLFEVDIYYGDEFMDYIYFTDNNVWTKNVPAPDDTWTEIGTGTFKDSWIAPGFFENLDDFVFDVTIERSDKNPDRYRIVDPYSNPLYDEYNISTKPGYIIFDISDPDFVIVEPGVRSGFKSADGGTFYCFNLEAYYLLVLPQYGMETSKEEIREWYEEDGLEISTYRDGVVTVPVSVWGNNSDPNGGYNWTDADGNPLPMLSIITMPTGGIGSLASDSAVAPVEYFNLQGVRVIRPSSGGIYIRRQGTDVTKVVIR